VQLRVLVDPVEEGQHRTEQQGSHSLPLLAIRRRVSFVRAHCQPRVLPFHGLDDPAFLADQHVLESDAVLDHEEEPQDSLEAGPFGLWHVLALADLGPPYVKERIDLRIGLLPSLDELRYLAELYSQQGH
jgi:hypothetical protein